MTKAKENKAEVLEQTEVKQPSISEFLKALATAAEKVEADNQVVPLTLCYMNGEGHAVIVDSTDPATGLLMLNNLEAFHKQRALEVSTPQQTA
ncbi:hypothetical protein [Kurthia sp. Dielmo]|uniref:hypothetical protein n=1 Tax=Kurthia sp. Dielmo TaxID=1033738 RepID=UPI00111DBF7E|nr:hypothetical protein [Kurthia sp. Dielmo]